MLLKPLIILENIFQKGEEAIPTPPQGWGFPCLKHYEIVIQPDGSIHGCWNPSMKLLSERK
jgi:hypothetical protein